MSHSKRVSVDLRESIQAYGSSSVSGDGSRVDTANGILRGVKVLGTNSSNDGGRRYLPEAIRRAVHLYEGASVRIDHPDKPSDQRSSECVIGWLRNVRIDNAGGLTGDLHYLKSHPFAARLVEVAKRNPRALGLSHNSDGDVEVRDGVTYVKEIYEVRSVDIVADPASTRSLFESKQLARTSHKSAPQFDKRQKQRRQRNTGTRGTQSMKLLEHFQRIPLLPRDRRTITSLFERKVMEADLDMPLMDEDPSAPMDTGMDAESAVPAVDDVADQSPEEALKQGFSAALTAVVNDTTIPEKDALRRIKELIVTRNKLTAAGQPVPEALGTDDMPADDAEDDDADEEMVLESDDQDADDLADEDAEKLMECDDEMDGKKTMKESKTGKKTKGALLQELKTLRTEKQVRELCESEGFHPSPIQLESLCGLSTEEKRREFILEAKTIQPRNTKPRTSNPAALTEARKTNSAPDLNVATVKTSEDFLRFITASNASANGN